jgi:nitrate reductase cytochrome c-type subunit
MKKIAMLMAVVLMSTGVMAQTVNPTPAAKAPKAKTAKATKAKAPKAEKPTKAPKATKATPSAPAPVQVNVSQNQSNNN